MDRESRVLAVVENPLEVETLAPVAEELRSQSHGRVRTEFISQDALLQQGADEAIQKRGLTEAEMRPPISVSESLLEMGTIRKVVTLFRTSRGLRPAVREYDAVLCGIDSVIARVLVQAANERKIRTCQVLPSLYLGNGCGSWKRWFRFLARYAAGTVLGIPFLRLPQGVARSGCDRIFVMGRRVREALIEEGVPGERIEATGVPRFADLVRLGKSNVLLPDSGDGAIRLLFVLGAYAWHGQDRLERLQARQLVALVESARQQSRPYRVVVRLHPRGVGAPEPVVRHDNVEISDPNVSDLEEDVFAADLVASHRSTALYEAVVLGRVALLLQFPGVVDRMGEVMKNDFVAADDAEELLARAERICSSDSRYRQTLDDERAAAREVIDPESPTSARRIAERILRDLGTDQTD